MALLDEERDPQELGARVEHFDKGKAISGFGFDR